LISSLGTPLFNFNSLYVLTTLVSNLYPYYINFRTNENGLCPACRQSYPEDPVNFQPLSSAELQKIKTEKKQKVLQQKNKIIEGRKHLSEYRVLQKNLVYAVGISQRMANPELLKKFVFVFNKFFF
jgi:CCR4-NOT transcription complex subunit 4